MLGPVAVAICLYSLSKMGSYSRASLYTKLSTRQQTRSSYVRLLRTLTLVILNESWVDLVYELLEDLS
jgi:hypothetical protein